MEQGIGHVIELKQIEHFTLALLEATIKEDYVNSWRAHTFVQKICLLSEAVVKYFHEIRVPW